MTPAEHYSEAERLLKLAQDWQPELVFDISTGQMAPPGVDPRPVVLAAAQVHATLATVEAFTARGMR